MIDSGIALAPRGREIAGYPVAWWTDMASNYPYVITTVLSLFLIVFKPKKPLMYPAGYCLIYFLVYLDAPLSLHLPIIVSISSSFEDYDSFDFLGFLWSLNIGKYITLICSGTPCSFLKVETPAPILYFLMVYSLNPLIFKYSLTSWNSGLSSW